MKLKISGRHQQSIQYVTHAHMIAETDSLTYTKLTGYKVHLLQTVGEDASTR